MRGRCSLFLLPCCCFLNKMYREHLCVREEEKRWRCGQMQLWGFLSDQHICLETHFIFLWVWSNYFIAEKMKGCLISFQERHSCFKPRQRFWFLKHHRCVQTDKTEAEELHLGAANHCVVHLNILFVVVVNLTYQLVGRLVDLRVQH